jgi:Mrp family chromosome partitioning ATPase
MITKETSHAGPATSAILPHPFQVRSISWDVSNAPKLGIYGFDSRDIRSRSFNLLRSRLARLLEKNDWRTIGVVSATPGAGKSFISCNLSAALSRLPEWQVYLFDLDLRRSAVASNFALEPETGIDRYLSGGIDDLAPVGMRIDHEDLIVFPSVASLSSSAELVAGDRMKRVIDEMRQLPPRVVSICDLPPVFANDDAAIVVGSLDAYLLIVEEGRTTKKQIRDTIGLLSPAICAGTVLNRYAGGIVSDDYGYGEGQSFGSYFKQ